MMVWDNWWDRGFHQLDRLLRTDAGRHHQNLSGESSLLGFLDEIQGPFRAKIHVEKDHGRAVLLQTRQRLRRRGELARDLESRFLFEYARETLTEHRVIVHQNNLDRCRIRSLIAPHTEITCQSIT